MKIYREQIRQLKKFISGFDTKNEILYLYVDEEGQVYLVLFHDEHVYNNYLKLGETREFEGTWQLSDNYKELKKWASKLKIDDYVLLAKDGAGFVFKHQDMKGEFNEYHTIADNTNILLGLDYFYNQCGTEYVIEKRKLDILRHYKNDYTCLSFEEGQLVYKFYNDDWKIYCKHIICDDNVNNGHCLITNQYFLKLLDKFHTTGNIHLWFDRDGPILIRHDDYIGVIAPRIHSLYDLEELV